MDDRSNRVLKTKHEQSVARLVRRVEADTHYMELS